MKLLYPLIFLLFSCATAPEDVHGCFDSQACNYDLSATIDNNSCSYPDINEICCLPSEVDCSGICYGENDLDECGICGGVDFVDCMDAIVFRTDFNSFQDLENFNYNSSHFQSIQVSDSLLEFVGIADEYQHLINYNSNSSLSNFSFSSNIRFNDSSLENTIPNYGLTIESDERRYKFAMVVVDEEFTDDKLQLKFSYFDFTSGLWSGGEYGWFNEQLDGFKEFKIVYSQDKLYCYLDNKLYFEKIIPNFSTNKFSIYNQDAHSYSIDNFFIYQNTP